jgi:hypothetical protein
MKRATLALVVMVVATVLAAGTAMAVVDDVQRSSAGRDAALDRALEELVSMRGGPPGPSPWYSATRCGRYTPPGLPI